MSTKFDRLQTVLKETTEIVDSFKTDNDKIIEENKNLKKELKEINIKYRILKNSITKTLNPIESKYDFTNAPNFLKVLQNIESTEGMERYMLQLGCFITNTRLENQLVIAGPGPSGKSTMKEIGRLLNERVKCIDCEIICQEGVILGIPGMVKFEYHYTRINGKPNMRFCGNPFLIKETENESIENINKCLEKTKYRLTKKLKFRPHHYCNIFSIRHIPSPMIMTTTIEDFNSEKCDTVYTEKIDYDKIDHCLMSKLEAEVDEIKSLCMQVYDKNKDKIITL